MEMGISSLRVNRIKILFYHSFKDYTFCNLAELKNVVQNIKEINKSSTYLPKITVIGYEYWLKFNLFTDDEYKQMENKLALTYQLK